jgi:hypothetical protein
LQFLSLGLTLTGNGRVPANANDPDLGSVNNNQSTQFAHGGEEAGYGGQGYVVIYL